MSTKLVSVILILFVSLTIFSNASTSSVVTGDENSVAVAMEKTKNIQKALSKASKTANKHCDQFDKTAILDRTEKAGKKDKAGVAYFSCVSQGGESTESSDEAASNE